MAYINHETSAKLRKALKEAFPEIKFSVLALSPNTLRVRIMESPYFDDGAAFSFSPYWLSAYFDGEQLAVLKKINQVVWDVCGWDEDWNPYADERFKYFMTVGRNGKPHVKTARKGEEK